MRGSSGLLLIVVALLVLWLAITNRWECFSTAFTCMTGDATDTPADNGAASLSPVESTDNSATARAQALLDSAHAGDFSLGDFISPPSLA